MKRNVVKFFIGTTLVVTALLSGQFNSADNVNSETLNAMNKFAQASSEGSFGCPNGCTMDAGSCYCYGFVDHYEYHW